MTPGEHIRRRRLDLGLRQRDLAERWGLRTETVARWERGLGKPSVRTWPRIIDLLGFDPTEGGVTAGARLEAARRRSGLTRRELAAKVGLDEGSICHWASGGRQPSPWMAGKVLAILNQLEGHDPSPGRSAPTFFDLTRWGRTPPPSIQPRTIGERLRAHRLVSGLSQRAMGAIFGVSRGTVHRWESGHRKPSEQQTMAIIRWFKVESPKPMPGSRGR